MPSWEKGLGPLSSEIFQYKAYIPNCCVSEGLCVLYTSVARVADLVSWVLKQLGGVSLRAKAEESEPRKCWRGESSGCCWSPFGLSGSEKRIS